MSSRTLRFELDDGVDGGAQLGRVVPLLGAAVAGVRPADLDLPTPCAAWTLRDLLNHVIGGAAMFAEAFGGAPVQDISGRIPDAVGNDPSGAFQGAATRFGEAVQQPGAMDVVLDLPFGPMTGRTFLRFRAFDLLVHTWDVSRVTRQAVEPPDELVEEITSFARVVLDATPRSDLFVAAAVPAPPGATPLERLVAEAGRQP